MPNVTDRYFRLGLDRIDCDDYLVCIELLAILDISTTPSPDILLSCRHINQNHPLPKIIQFLVLYVLTGVVGYVWR